MFLKDRNFLSHTPGRITTSIFIRDTFIRNSRACQAELKRIEENTSREKLKYHKKKHAFKNKTLTEHEIHYSLLQNCLTVQGYI